MNWKTQRVQLDIMTQVPVPAASSSYMTHRQALQDSYDLKR
jgi:hypothetical protein